MSTIYYLLCATFLTNRTPSKVLNSLFPFEKLFGKATNYSMFRSFGCLSFASTLKARRTKFDPRVTACIFLGYPVRVKGYKMLDLITRRVFISRDVTFYEAFFLFQTSEYKHQQNPFDSYIVTPPGRRRKRRQMRH